MEYSEFLQQVSQCISRKTGSGIRVAVNEVLKNNRSPAATLSILRDGENVSPAIYMDAYFRQYREGLSVGDVADRILEWYETYAVSEKINVDFYSDFAKVRGRILYKLINFEKNREMLRQVPWRRFHDLALVCYYKMEEKVLGPGSILIQNSHLKLWGVPEEDVFSAADKNMGELLPYELLRLQDMLRDTFGLELQEEDEREFDTIPMYVLTNADRTFGAAYIAFPRVQREIGDFLGDYYVLPSSIHECMILPELSWMNKEELRTMVREINEEHVAPEEVLGDSVYWYSSREQSFCRICPEQLEPLPQPAPSAES